MTRAFIPALNVDDVPWTPGSKRHQGLREGWVQEGPASIGDRWFFKELSRDPETGAQTMLFNHRKGVRFPAAGFHEAFEESLLIRGKIRAYEDSPDVPNIYRAGSYFYRPPGWIHDSDILEDTLVLRMVDREDSRKPMARELIGRNHLLPGPECVEPRGYLRNLQSEDLDWVPAFEFIARQEWEIDLTYVAYEHWDLKLLSRDRTTGAVSCLQRFRAGFLQPNLGYSSVDQEHLLISGQVRIGDHELRAMTYSYRPSGYLMGPMEATEDSLIFSRFTGRLLQTDLRAGEVDTQVSLRGEVAMEAPQ